MRLETANAVYGVAYLVMSTGDMPFRLGDLDIMAVHYREWGTKGKIVAVFHGDAAYLVLNDAAYNADRRILNNESYSGNPYGELMVGLMNQGVQIELCGAGQSRY